jgi:hypothetical protein
MVMHSSADEKLPLFLDNCKSSFASDRTGGEVSPILHTRETETPNYTSVSHT